MTSLPFLPRWQLPSALSLRWQRGWSSDRRCPPPWCSPVGPAGRWRTTRSGCSSADSSSCPRTPPSSSADRWYQAAGLRRGRFGPSTPGWGSSPSSSSGPNGRTPIRQPWSYRSGVWLPVVSDHWVKVVGIWQINSSKMNLVSLKSEVRVVLSSSPTQGCNTYSDRKHPAKSVLTSTTNPKAKRAASLSTKLNIQQNSPLLLDNSLFS